MLHVVSLTPLLQSLFLALCSPAPRTVAAHTLPGYRDKEAGAGGLVRVALILEEGRSQYTLQPQTDVSGALPPPRPPPGKLRGRLEFKWEKNGAWWPDRAKSFLQGVGGCMELVVWSLGSPRAAVASVL